MINAKKHIPGSDKSLQVIFEPIGRRVQIPPSVTCLAAAQKGGIGLLAVCNGAGTCHQCLVRLIQGELNPPTDIEKQALTGVKLGSGLRLACQAIPLTDVIIELPAESISSDQRLQVEGLESDVSPEPVVTAIDFVIPAMSNEVRDSRVEQLVSSLRKRHPSVELSTPVMEQVSATRIGSEGQARLVVHDNGMAVGVLAANEHLCGLAFDIGTTKLAAYLVDLENGQTIAKSGLPNPQISYGEDVISRIAYANQGTQETGTLRQVLLDALNQLVATVSKSGRVASRQLVDAVVVGNTAMHHFFTGNPTRQLGEAPYIPAVRDALLLSASDLGLPMAPGAQVYLPPIIAGFVGADHVAADLACGLTEAGDNALLVDIGTNTEITLRTAEGLFCCSCASGPAFEGAHIQAGMRAAPGAIERVYYHDGKWNYQTVGDKPPTGICGSGILDAVAEMYRVGVIDQRGSLQAGIPGVTRQTQGLAFGLVPAGSTSNPGGIQITRRDVNEIQLAKAAIRAGIEILLKTSGLRAGQVTKFIVAGAFGTYLHLPSTVGIGMFPDLPEERFIQVGNAAGAGARMLLVSRVIRHAASELQNRMHYIELTTREDFQDVFMAALPIIPRISFQAA